MKRSSGMALARFFAAGFVLVREGALSVIDPRALPPVVRAGFGVMKLVERRAVKARAGGENLRRALERLGPTYVKIGQALATRPDLIGDKIAADLALLQDKIAPFDGALVLPMLAEALATRADDLKNLSPPVAAASIAQVHRADLVVDGAARKVAVKLLRPGIAARFSADLDAQRAGARLAERLFPKLRRLRPTEIVETLARAARIELDLRLEAAAISELTQNIRDDSGFVIPAVHWDHTSETVLTTSWVDGIPIRDLAGLDAAGLDRRALAKTLLQSFLRHAIRDGFFHADLHQGNVFADPATGAIVAVDFGIMGRIGRRERRFLAEILYGFITRDYRGIAQRHFDIGYVPAHHSVDDFALALRAIGEPLQGRRAVEISMAKVLGQLFLTTEIFDMRTRPELVLLQKSMVLVEGVARQLDPELDIWTVSEPVVGDFVRREAGPAGRLEDLADRAEGVVDAASRLPALVHRAEAALDIYLQKPARRVPWLFWGLALFGLGVLFGAVLL